MNSNCTAAVGRCEQMTGKVEFDALSSGYVRTFRQILILFCCVVGEVPPNDSQDQSPAVYWHVRYKGNPQGGEPTYLKF